MAIQITPLHELSYTAEYVILKEYNQELYSSPLSDNTQENLKKTTDLLLRAEKHLRLLADQIRNYREMLEHS